MAVSQFFVDIGEITKSLDALDAIPRFVLNEVAREIEGVGKEILITSFEAAMYDQSYDSFPQEFRDHVFNVVEKAKFDTFVINNAFSVSFNFDQLGNREQLTRAFHQGALLADGSRLDGPYTGQPLMNEDPAERHIFWESVQKGLASAPNPKGAGHIPIKPNAWEETKKKYVEIWGSEAPEWLYLQFGQAAWEPHIIPYPIIEEFTEDFLASANLLFQTAVTEKIEAAQAQGAALTSYGIRDVKSGRFTKLR